MKLNIYKTFRKIFNLSICVVGSISYRYEDRDHMANLIKKISLVLVIFTAVSNSFVYPQKKEDSKAPEAPVRKHWDNNLPSRQEPVIHKYLTIQAWNIVRAEHPEVIGSEMDIAMSNPYNPGIYGDWWSNEYDGLCYSGNIVSGAFREDSEDIIYNSNNHTAGMVSITHFWLADLGDTHEPIFWGARRNNAIQKARALWSGYQYVSCGTWPAINLNGYSNYSCIEHNPPPGHSEIYRYKETLIPSSGNSIKEVFANPLANLGAREIAITVYLTGQPLPHTCEAFFIVPQNPILPLSSFSARFPPNVDINAYKKLCWNAVGRICHLIEDMGVPAHTHFDTHVPIWPICDDDYYEYRYMSLQGHYQDITSEKALLQGGSIDLSNKADPIRYALYTANQVADRFPSNDGDANLVIDRSHPDRYQDMLDPIYANITAGLGQFGDFPPPGLMAEITENAGIYSIRATAGFLYWVFQQFNIQPVTPVNITLSNHNVINSFNYAALNSITTNNIFNIKNTSTVNFQAGNSVTLHSGFHAQQGSSFHAFIQSPMNNFSVRNTQEVSREELSAATENEKENKSLEKTAEDLSVEEMPEKFKLYQNYPNGFNPSTKIMFDVPFNTKVNITVYDILGRTVATLVNSELRAGRYETVFDGSNISSGIYYYIFQAADYVETKKMLLIK